MTTRRVVSAIALLGVLVPASAWARGDVRLELKDGIVTLDARDATVRQILSEWARVGNAKIVNADKAPGGPITLQLTGVPERQALDILLRSAGGYMAAPRPATATGASIYDRILILPTSAPVTAAVTAAPAPPANRPGFPQTFQGDPDQDEEPVDGFAQSPNGPTPLLPNNPPPRGMPMQPQPQPGYYQGQGGPAFPGNTPQGATPLLPVPAQGQPIPVTGGATPAGGAAKPGVIVPVTPMLPVQPTPTTTRPPNPNQP